MSHSDSSLFRFREFLYQIKAFRPVPRVEMSLILHKFPLIGYDSF